MVKTIRKILIAMLVLFLACGCTAKQSPADPVKGYLDLVKKNNNITTEDLLEFFASEDEMDDEELSEEVFGYGSDFMKIITSSLSYKINSATVTDDTHGEVNVSVTNLDTSRFFNDVFMDYFSWAMTQAFSGTDLSEEDYGSKFVELLSAAASEHKDDTVTKDLIIDVKKADGVWKISDGTDLIDASMGFILSAMENFNWWDDTGTDDGYDPDTDYYSGYEDDGEYVYFLMTELETYICKYGDDTYYAAFDAEDYCYNIILSDDMYRALTAGKGDGEYFEYDPAMVIYGYTQSVPEEVVTAFVEVYDSALPDSDTYYDYFGFNCLYVTGYEVYAGE